MSRVVKIAQVKEEDKDTIGLLILIKGGCLPWLRIEEYQGGTWRPHR